MRTIQAEDIKKAVHDIAIEANTVLPPDVVQALAGARKVEPWEDAEKILGQLEENALFAREEQIPICQDTGAACLFFTIGTDVHIEGDFQKAVNDGVAEGYRDGYLRASIVKDPIRRGNTGDNTPAFITVSLKPGDGFHVTLLPKGFGSENMSALKMLRPADGRDGVIDFILQTVKKAGPNPCPPVVLGVGLGGTFDTVAAAAKHALLRPLGKQNEDPFYSNLEQELLEKINALGIGPQGLGGKTTCLGVAIEALPTHVAGLPVAVNISCHALRRAERSL